MKKIMKKTLQECKEIIAKELGYKDFDEALWVDNVFFAETAIDLANKMFYEQSEWIRVEAMKEYARIQIEKDRERIKDYLGEGILITQINKVIDETPIILD